MSVYRTLLSLSRNNSPLRRVSCCGLTSTGCCSRFGEATASAIPSDGAVSSQRLFLLRRNLHCKTSAGGRGHFQQSDYSSSNLSTTAGPESSSYAARFPIYQVTTIQKQHHRTTVAFLRHWSASRALDGPGPMVSAARLMSTNSPDGGGGASGNPPNGNGSSNGGGELADSEGAVMVYENRDDLGSLSTIKVPEFLPNIPVITINRYPLFPGFIKRVEIVNDENLKRLIKRKVELKLPYVGVFVKRDNEDKSESVTSISQLYTVGTFAHIIEVREAGPLMELIVNAHRRIRILEPLDESKPATGDGQAPHGDRAARGASGGGNGGGGLFSRLNGRRTANQHQRKVTAAFDKLFLNKKDQQQRQQPSPTATTEQDELSTSKQQQQSPAQGSGGEGGESTAGPEGPSEPPVIYARTENFITEPMEKTVEIKALMQAMVQAIRDIVSYSPLFGQQINLLLHPQHNVVDNPVYLCDLVATLVQGAETEDLQNIMQEPNIRKRLDFALELLEKEKTIAKLKHDISKDVEKKVQDQHRKYLLTEQLKAIKRELGIEKDDKQAVVERFDERLKTLNVPEYAMKVIKEEQAKLGYLDPHSSEFSVSRNYLDWLTSIPWGKMSEENTDLKRAKQILDEDHYGMVDVKDRILEFIAVGILKKSTTGKILCFYGPPGVGKTSIAKSIARALNREYFRFSVGGLYDVAELKGHRRTYIGAMPGKMVQCLKKVQTENPLVLIDEVDKMGGPGYHGDPASALLELLDPEQNANFLDHFLDVPVDLSKVLFICTANVLDTIPGPLKDRMETIEVSGYVSEEKMAIAKNYLIPQCREKCALPAERLQLTDSVLDALLKHYCRESGVRSLQKHIEKIFRKAAYKIAGSQQQSDATEEAELKAEACHQEDSADEGTEPREVDDTPTTTAAADEVPEDPTSSTSSTSSGGSANGDDLPLPIVVNEQNLTDYVGREKFVSDRLYDKTPPGVIMGLAWTSMGGSALYVEARLARRLSGPSQPPDWTAPSAGQPPQQQPAPAEQGSLEVTGHLGDVMKESTRTAYTVAKNVLMAKQADNDFLERAHIHVHVPEGAVPKDGPSAGCTVASALISLALDRPARLLLAGDRDVAMTGEVSLTGKVLPVGGIKEKVMAAKRAGIGAVILPADNRKDFDDLPEFVRRDVDAHFVAHYDQLYELVFGSPAPAPAIQ